MSENTKLWDILGRTDPAHTKQFKRAGGFSGTAIKPMWAYRRMTEEFGPCGIDWGIGEPSFNVVPANEGEILVYCTASVWYKQGDQASQAVYGVGGDKVAGKNKYGLSTDDEAFKKAFTDAITNALKMIGVGADVHMGMFDDNKYVNAMREEFLEPAPKSSYALKQDKDANGDDPWQRAMKDLANDLADCHSTVALTSLWKDYAARAKAERWNQGWIDQLKERFATEGEAIKKTETVMAG